MFDRPTGHPALPGGLFCVIGNPLSDGTWTYTWEKGRQLKSMSNGSTTASFKYNSDGLRVQKTVGSVVTNYTLHGKNIVHMTQGSNSLHFFYDASNKPAIVDFNGTKYAYVHNLQGDIVAILDNNGNVVVQYKYDAWGKPISKTGSLASTLGTVQPFRYRGYVYDEETGLYYLRSRYYNTAWHRFVNMDTQLSNLFHSLCDNVYAYCGNDPCCMLDPNGTEYISSMEELDTLLMNNRLNGTYSMYVYEFLNNAHDRIGTPYRLCQCSTLIDTSAGQKTSSEGMSTMFREKSLAVGSIAEIGYENLPTGTILGKLKTYQGRLYTGGVFDPAKIRRGDVSHGGIFLKLDMYNGEMCVWILQSTASSVKGVDRKKREACVQITAFPIEKMNSLGWNVWMWDRRIMPDEYQWYNICDGEAYDD